MAADTVDQGATLSLPEAAAELDVHPSTVRRYIREGVIPAHKAEGTHGPEWRIYAADLEAFAQGGRRVPRGLTQTDSEFVELVQERFAHLEHTLVTRLGEIVEAQKALRPSPEEVQARAEREARMEGALAGNAQAVRAIAEELGQVRAERDALAAELDEARAQVAELEEQLNAERGRSWWDKLRRRD